MSAAPATNRMYRRVRLRVPSPSKVLPSSFADEEAKAWFYPALAKKVSPKSDEFEAYFNNLLDSPLRTIIAVTPVKKIMYNSSTAGRHMAGTISEEELGERQEADKIRMNKLRQARGLDER